MALESGWRGWRKNILCVCGVHACRKEKRGKWTGVECNFLLQWDSYAHSYTSLSYNNNLHSNNNDRFSLLFMPTSHTYTHTALAAISISARQLRVWKGAIKIDEKERLPPFFIAWKIFGTCRRNRQRLNFIFISTTHTRLLDALTAIFISLRGSHTFLTARERERGWADKLYK